MTLIGAKLDGSINGERGRVDRLWKDELDRAEKGKVDRKKLVWLMEWLNKLDREALEKENKL